MPSSAIDLIRAYYDAFNRQDVEAFLSLLSDDVVHDLNQGGREIGKERFRHFIERMNRSYREEIRDLAVMTTADGRRGAAEFIVHGTYLQTDPGLPEAHGQQYQLAAGAYFELRDGKVARITNYYNLADWVAQVTPA